MRSAKRALLFDIDGTLADTDALHRDAFNQALGPFGHVFDHARYTRRLRPTVGRSLWPVGSIPASPGWMMRT
jgi:beta-phosphoglucomutase-like phosphatase (HAD superfamily)